jgi:hypothetical protein
VLQGIFAQATRPDPVATLERFLENWALLGSIVLKVGGGSDDDEHTIEIRTPCRQERR